MIKPVVMTQYYPIATSQGLVSPPRALEIFMIAEASVNELKAIYSQLSKVSSDLAYKAGQYVLHHAKKYPIAILNYVVNIIQLEVIAKDNRRKEKIRVFSQTLRSVKNKGPKSGIITFNTNCLPTVTFFCNSPFTFGPEENTRILNSMVAGKWVGHRRTYDVTLNVQNEAQIWYGTALLIKHVSGLKMI